MLINEKYDIAGVFCQPDRKSGRGHKVSFSPVKETALAHGLPVFQFEKIKSPEGVQALKSLNIDLMITAAFGQILSQEILDIRSGDVLTYMLLYLPKYRGAAPVQWAIINGETETGLPRCDECRVGYRRHANQEKNRNRGIRNRRQSISAAGNIRR